MKHLHTLFILTIIGCLSHATAQERPLKIKDVIKLTVFGEESLGSTIAIDSSGSVSFPLIGGIEVAGKSAKQVASQVETLLENGYIRDANVTVTVEFEYVEPKKEVKPIIKYKKPAPVQRAVAIAKPAKPISKVTILGEVRAPGTIQFEGTQTDILVILSQVRGLTPLANPKKVQVRRVGKNAQIFNVDVNKLQSSTEQFFIKSGDVITVRKRII